MSSVPYPNPQAIFYQSPTGFADPLRMKRVALIV
jgi:hypothetical protein